MNTQERDFLKIISAALTGQTAEFTGYRTEEEWKCLYKISVHQNLLLFNGALCSRCRG